MANVGLEPRYRGPPADQVRAGFSASPVVRLSTVNLTHPIGADVACAGSIDSLVG